MSIYCVFGVLNKKNRRFQLIAEKQTERVKKSPCKIDMFFAARFSLKDRSAFCGSRENKEKGTGFFAACFLLVFKFGTLTISQIPPMKKYLKKILIFRYKCLYS